MKTIELTKGRYAVVDDEDFLWLNQWKWFTKEVGGCAYAVRNKSRKEAGPRRLIYMHREIMGNPDGPIDHRNGIGTDNRRQNLRLCTTQENQRNRGPASNNTSGYKGVYFHKPSKKWYAEIVINGKKNKKRLGAFKHKEEAAMAYDIEARKHFGEFAYLNFGGRCGCRR